MAKLDLNKILLLLGDDKVISFAVGNPAPETYPVENIKQFSKLALDEHGAALLSYTSSQGFAELRERLVPLLQKREHIVTTAQDIIVTNGSQQMCALALDVLLKPGDTILCEAPSYMDALENFERRGLKVVQVPMQQDGVDVDALARALEQHKNAKAFYTIPNFQNPTGITMAAQKRKKVYELACAHNIYVIEDNPYADLRFIGSAIPSIKSLDEADRVIYMGSFSKILAPGLRVGYGVVPKNLMAPCLAAKIATDIHTPMLNQAICASFLEFMDYEKHIKDLSAVYEQRNILLLGQLRASVGDLITFTAPEGGMFIWCELPQHVDESEFVQACFDAGLAILPAYIFYAKDVPHKPGFRISYAGPGAADIIDGVEILEKVVKTFVK